MPGIKDLVNVWKNLKEVDLRPYQDAAMDPVKLVIVGQPGSGRHTLADQLHRDPQRPENSTDTAVLISDLSNSDWMTAADLVILVLDATAQDFGQERTLAKKCSDAGKMLITYVNKVDLLENKSRSYPSTGWEMGRVVRGSALDLSSLQRDLVPVVLELLPERHLSLGRHFSIFRLAIARKLINDTCFSNAVYSLSTGVAEVVPILDLPLNLTDMVVLTKAQAFLVYKLGLSLGFSTRWEDYLKEFGGVIGSGFVWRQLSRMLIGLIPVWGIVPKIAIAYSGTYVVGNVVMQWYLTGRQVSSKQIQAISNQALIHGRQIAQNLAARLPRPRLGRRKSPVLLQAENTRPCPFCGKPNAPDALFCQYCGQSFQAG
jgi:uncharacterized protein (DUF697 family)